MDRQVNSSGVTIATSTGTISWGAMNNASTSSWFFTQTAPDFVFGNGLQPSDGIFLGNTFTFSRDNGNFGLDEQRSYSASILLSSPTGMTVAGSGNVFQENMTAQVNSVITFLVLYHDGHYGFKPADPSYNDSHGEIDPWIYNFPMSQTITLISSVKADNAIGIQFPAETGGNVSITSSGPVFLDGDVLTNGLANITAKGSILADPVKASITAANITLAGKADDGSGSIGSADALVQMTLAPGGVFNASAGLNGVYANFDSLAIVGQVISSDNAQHYGDVNVQSTGGLLRASAAQSVNQSPVITGRNILLGGGTGSIGAEGNPLVLQPNPTILVNGGKRDGVVNALAQSDVVLQVNQGDLSPGSIVSSQGNVNLNVPNGSILNANTSQSPSQTTDQLNQVTQDLHLTDLSFGQVAIQGFESLVDSRYQQYWHLIANGNSNAELSLTDLPQGIGVSVALTNGELIRTSGSWTADGFAVGQFITVSGTQSNNGSYLIQAVSADGLTLTLAQSQPETVANLGVDSSIGHLSGSPTLTFAPSNNTTSRITGTSTTLSFQPGDSSTNRVQVGTQLTFVPGAFSSQPRIVRPGGDWNAEGFVPGETITVFGTAGSGASEDGTYTIQSISPDGRTLLLGDSPKFTARTVTTSASVGIAINNGLISRNSGSWKNDGFASGQSIAVFGTAGSGPSEDGTYSIAAISDNAATLVLTVGQTLQARTGVAQAGVAITNATISRNSGSWIADQFAAGQTIVVNGTLADDNSYVVSAISADGKTLFLQTGATLAAGTAAPPKVTGSKLTGNPTLTFAGGPGVAQTIVRSTGTWLADGFNAGQSITITGSQANDGVYTIASIDSGGYDADGAGAQGRNRQ